MRNLTILSLLGFMFLSSAFGQVPKAPEAVFKIFGKSTKNL